MSRSRLALAVLVGVLVGCGEERSEGGAKPRTAGGEPATTTEAAEPAKTTEAATARSDRACADLWNTAVLRFNAGAGSDAWIELDAD